MSRLLNYFLRGLVFVTPVALTVYVAWWVFHQIDSWLGLSVPGAGFVITIALTAFQLRVLERRVSYAR